MHRNQIWIRPSLDSTRLDARRGTGGGAMRPISSANLMKIAETEKLHFHSILPPRPNANQRDDDLAGAGAAGFQSSSR